MEISLQLAEQSANLKRRRRFHSARICGEKRKRGGCTAHSNQYQTCATSWKVQYTRCGLHFPDFSRSKEGRPEELGEAGLGLKHLAHRYTSTQWHTRVTSGKVGNCARLAGCQRKNGQQSSHSAISHNLAFGMDEYDIILICTHSIRLTLLQPHRRPRRHVPGSPNHKEGGEAEAIPAQRKGVKETRIRQEPCQRSRRLCAVREEIDGTVEVGGLVWLAR